MGSNKAEGGAAQAARGDGMNDSHMSEYLKAEGSGEEWTAEQLTWLLDQWEAALDQLGYCPIAYPDRGAIVGRSLLSSTRFDCLNHAYWMCGCVRRFVRENRIAVAYRWAGMIQGLLFMGGVYSLEKLTEQERHVPVPVRQQNHFGGKSPHA